MTDDLELKGHLPPGTRQSDIDRHHSGEAQGYEPPQVLVTCEVCGGEGWIPKAPWRTFPDDPYYYDQVTCETCHGAGDLIEDAKPDSGGSDD